MAQNKPTTWNATLCGKLPVLEVNAELNFTANLIRRSTQHAILSNDNSPELELRLGLGVGIALGLIRVN